MRTEVSVITNAEVDNESGNFVINCFANMNEDGTFTPTIYKSDVAEKLKTVDGVVGKEGELLISHSGDSVGEINENGELIIEPDGDDANKYSKQNENLIYEG